jgi:PAS domain S-box-containing protein
MYNLKALKVEQVTHILHVDDDISNLEISKQILTCIDKNFEIDQATSVDEALKKIATTHYNAIISDYEMPKKNGLQFLKELRQQGNDIPFVIFTGKGKEEIAIKALNLGADGYYNKNGSPETVYGELLYGIKAATEKRKAKQSLEEKEKRHMALINQSTSLFIVHDLDGQIVEVNLQASKCLGYTQEELLSKNIADLDSEAAHNKNWPSILPKVLRGEPVTFESFMINKAGKKFPIATSLGSIQLNDKTLVFGFVRDLTENKRAEEALKQERDLHESITEAIGCGLAIINKDYRIIRANDFIKQYKGDVVGKLCYATLNSLDAPCPDCGVTKIFAGKTNVDSHEYHSTRLDGKQYWVEIIATPLKDKIGNIIAAVEISIDITERKNGEEDLEYIMQQLMLVNEKLGVVGSLTRHDVSNKLNIVSGVSYLLKKRYMDQVDVVEGLVKIEQAVKESSKIFEFAKTYEALGVEEFKYVDVGNAFNEAMALFSGLNLRVINDCDGLSLFADSFLRQLFYNLIDNTRKYGGKTTAIRVYYEKLDLGALRLIYEDDGVGISAENKSKLFSKGFSTGGSSGFGLFLIKKMMDVYGWTITETGEPGKGAKFTIIIPNSNLIH